jgi:HlyD family secretion protein
MVDIQRPPEVARRKKMRRILYAGVGVLVIAGITVGVSRMKPAAPSVERATVWVDQVKRGPMLRQVRGSGTLVPEEIRWIPAVTEGRVERIVLRPGAVVNPNSVILELSNPELEQTAREAQLQLQSAEAALKNRRVELESQLLNQRSVLAQLEAEYEQAKLQAEADEKLAKEALVSDLTLKISKSRADQLGSRVQLERKRYEMSQAGMESQLAVQQSDVDRLRNLYQLRQSQLDQLRVRAGNDGVLQLVPVEVGARVAPGTNLARVANPQHLKAELRIAETQAKDIMIGQVAQVDTRNGIIPGRVSRIDPAAQNGTVTVDVALEGELPRGARPDLTVDGTVELERLEDVINVGRPAFGQENSVVTLFKLVPGTSEAIRVKVTLGRSSVNTIEIKEGLQPGDQVILSDMSSWDQFDRVRLS